MIKEVIISMSILGGSVSLAHDVTPPTGGEVFRLLFENAGMDLKSEENCLMPTKDHVSEKELLSDYLSDIFSLSYNSERNLSISSSCTASKYETSADGVQAMWDCQFEMNETDDSGEFVSSSMLAFGISLDKSKILKNTLRCF